MVEDELATDGARRAASHDEVKAEVRGGVQSAIAQQAEQPAPGEPARIERVVAQLRVKAVDEVVGAERALGVARVVARISQVADYLFCIVYALLGLRFLVGLMAARSGAGFVVFLVAISDPFYAPFRGIVASANLGEGHVVVLSFVFAIVVYLMAHLAVNRLLHVIAQRRPTL